MSTKGIYENIASFTWHPPKVKKQYANRPIPIFDLTPLLV